MTFTRLDLEKESGKKAGLFLLSGLQFVELASLPLGFLRLFRLTPSSRAWPSCILDRSLHTLASSGKQAGRPRGKIINNVEMLVKCTNLFILISRFLWDNRISSISRKNLAHGCSYMYVLYWHTPFSFLLFIRKAIIQ